MKASAPNAGAFLSGQPRHAISRGSAIRPIALTASRNSVVTCRSNNAVNNNRVSLEGVKTVAQRRLVSWPAANEEQPLEETSKLTFLQALVNTQGAFERTTNFMVGPLLPTLTEPQARLRALVTKQERATGLEAVRDTDLGMRLSVPEELKVTIQLAQAQLAAAKGSWGFQLLHDAKRVLNDALEAVAAVAEADRHVSAWLLRLFRAIGTVERCVRSVMVEQPSLSEGLQRRIGELEPGTLPPSEAVVRYEVTSRSVQPRNWNEGPVPELLRIATMRVGEAQRRIASPPVGWESLLEPAREWLKKAAVLIEDVRRESSRTV